MVQTFLLYGATGYTGKLIAAEAKAKGIAPILAGRSAEKLEALAGPLGLTFDVFTLDQSDKLDAALESVDVVIHAAGPFSKTWKPMVEACLRTKTHYLDITGEIEVFERCARLDEQAKEVGVMLMPGTGYDVVPSDCLAQYVNERLPGGHHLTLAMTGMGRASRGTAKTAMEKIGGGTFVRRGGKISKLSEPMKRQIDFGKGARPALAVSWGDVATAYHSTGAPDIEVFFESRPDLEKAMTMKGPMAWLMQTRLGQAFIHYQIDKRPEGPNEEMRATGSCTIVAEMVDGCRNRFCARLTTPEAYKLTSWTALEIATRVMNGDVRPGFQTPSLMYGADFILEFEGVTREDADGSIFVD